MFGSVEKTFRRYSSLLKYCLLATPFVVVSCATQNQENEEYYSVDDYANVSKTDVHVHVFTDSNDFAEIARAENFKLVSVALDAANTNAGVKRQFEFCQLQKANNPSTVETITAFSMEGWDQPDWLQKNLAWLDSSINEGAIGVKIWKNVGMVYRDKDGKLVMIDDPRFDPIFKMLAGRQVPVLGHLGEPKNCWLPLEEMTTNNDRNYFEEHPQYHMYQHPDLPSYEEQIAARDRMLEK
ncbi:MAG: amidohydrolase, partial [Bacteroidota bacterium]|nr:amidohydrolase [Bacteroidota bacterium]